MASPKIVVFDLDYTLWPYYINSEDVYVDRAQKPINTDTVKAYPDVPRILSRLERDNCQVAAVSRCWSPRTAIKCLKKYKLYHYFNYIIIKDVEKTYHFNILHLQSGVEYKDMLFFDDEPNNVKVGESIGVVAVRVIDEMSSQLMERGLRKFRTRR